MAASIALAFDGVPRPTASGREAGGIYFEPNVGQADPSVSWIARAPSYTAFLESRAVTFACSNHSAARPTVELVRMELGGASGATELSGRNRLPGVSNYFIGPDPRRWRTRVPHYARLDAEEIYPGVSARFYGFEGLLEYDLAFKAGVDPHEMKVVFRGGETPRLNTTGDLVIETGSGEIHLRRPRAYQIHDGSPEEVAVSYDVAIGGQVRFRVADYDSSLPLVIDPVINYSTYLGLAGSGTAVAVDSSGRAYVAGYSTSLTFPFTHAIQTTLKGTYDAFVAKFDASGTSLVYATYLGGTGDDLGRGIAVDASGNAYIAGTTYSPDFPLANARQFNFGGGVDAFVAKLSADGSSLLFSTYLGGSGSDEANTIALDASSNVYVAGYTTSTDFPTANAYQSSRHGMVDAFLAKLDPTGGSLLYSTYFGGSVLEKANAVVIDSSGSAWIGGVTESNDLPTMNPLQASFAGQQDGFLAHFAANGSLLSSTYFGGGQPDSVNSLATDSSGNLIIYGQTNSWADFPLVNAMMPDSNSFNHCFLAKLSSSGAIAFSTFVAGSTQSVCGGVAVDSSGNTVFVGSATDDYPVMSSIGSGVPVNVFGVFVSKLAADGSSFRFSTFLGTAHGQQDGRGVAVDSSGAIYVTGDAYGDIPLVNPINSATSGSLLPFVAKLTDNSACSYTVSPTQVTVPTAATAVTISVTAGSNCWWNSTGETVLGGVETVTSLEGSQTHGTHPWPLARGNGTVSFTVPTSTSALTRSQTIVVAGRAVTITQLGYGCSYSLGFPDASVPPYGGSYPLVVNTNGDCPATAVSNVPWITIPNPTVVSGGAITYVVAPNLGAQRSGTISVAGLAFTVNQAAFCPNNFASSGQVIGSDPYSGTVTVVASAGCPWRVTSDVYWMQTGSPDNGTGSGSMTFYVSVNPGATRSGTLRLGSGDTFTVTQVGAAASKAGVYNPTQGVFVLDANGNFVWDGTPADLYFLWGAPNNIPVIGDWDGSGKKKVGVFNPTNAIWLLDVNGNGVWDGPSVDRMVSWGSPGDVPVVGNWNGAGTQDKIGVFSPSTALWLLDYNGNFTWDGAGTDKYFSWGSPNDKPVVGNWSGLNNQDKVGVFNPSQGWWVLDYDGNFVWDGAGTDRFFHWGSPGDTPVVGDWNGSGSVKVGVYNSTQAVYLLDYNGNFIWDGTPADKYFSWGSPNDKPVVGDWNGSGTTKVGVFNSSQGWWVLDYNGNFLWDGAGTDRYIYWGSPGDTPLVARW